MKVAGADVGVLDVPTMRSPQGLISGGVLSVFDGCYLASLLVFSSPRGFAGIAEFSGIHRENWRSAKSAQANCA
jgi:hypothetical protein